MKTFYFIKLTVFLQLIFICFLQNARSNWISPSENKIEKNIQKNSGQTSIDVSSEFINSLVDENGNPVIKMNHGDSTITDAVSEKFLNGAATGDAFGYSVSGAGDVNGDGYNDIIAGAPYNDAGGTDGGRAYIYFGGAIFNSSPDVIFSGSANLLFGSSVSGAGDLNGDGYSDVIIGAPGYSASTGRSYIYFGGSPMNTGVDVTLTGEATNNIFGYCVSGNVDINGDSFSDVIVGAPGYSSSTGRAYVYYGGATMNNVADLRMTGSAINNYFGNSVSEGGNFNGDGYGDFVIGAYGSSSNSGAVLFFLGGAVPDTLSDWVQSGAATSQLGYDVANAGDINGDGYTEIIAGSPAIGTGVAYVFYGGPVVIGGIDLVLTGENTGDNFGNSVSFAGDFNADGYDDMIVGARNFNSNTGKAYLFKGGLIPNSGADKFFNGDFSSDEFGFSVNNCGDIDGDGITDIIIGATSNDINGAQSGRAYVFMASMTGSEISDLTFSGATSNDFFGNSVSSAGDVNGDGYDDIIVGSVGYNALSYQGRAFIYYGGPLMNNVADVTMTGAASSDLFGNSVSSAGDVNGDGFDDVIVGANYYNAGTEQGRAYIFFGGGSMNNIADVILTGITAGDRFGTSVSSAGDVNADGYFDVIVGAEAYNGNRGRVYLYYGGSSMNNSADVFISGFVANDYFGNSVSNAGDVNGDGYSDIIIGAEHYNGGTNQGKAGIYFGGSSMDNNEDVTLTGVSSGDYFGHSVSTAGDVNGDSYADVVVGARAYNGAQGRAYVFFGGVVMNSTADATLTGIAAGDELGSSVSSGDVNNDGYSDVIVGAQDAFTNSGQTYVYFGGVSMNNTVDVVYTGRPSSDFGKTVASAGDVNGDGLCDVLVGAESENFFAGTARLYMSTALEVKPRIVSVKDVSFDQGGFVNLKWMRSGYDTQAENLITGYLVERSSPPGLHGFSWTAVTTVPSIHNLSYEYQASTPNDSMSGNSGLYYFRITAQTSVTNQYWRSNILSGYSVDNLAPFAPQSLAANVQPAYVALDWDQNLEADLHHYNIYRNGNLIAASVNSDYHDATAQEDSTYNYQIAAVDIHGNISPLSNIANVTINNFGNINLSVIMEGFYNASANQMEISDTARLYLRNSSAPYALVDSSKGVVNNISLSGSFNFMSTVTGNYYIVIKHRNTIETWSSNPVNYTAGSLTNFSFITSSTQAYGGNQKQVDTSPARFAIYSGDENQDGIVDVTDLIDIYNDALNITSGYVSTDLNGDDFVDVTDLIITYNNSINIISVITP